MQPETFERMKLLAKHLLFTLGFGVVIILILFFIYLPISTNHGETITVPDIKGQQLSDLEKILISRNLRYEVNTDSGYSAAKNPLTVLDQFPKANAKVKENRKIYVTLNARIPPLVRMPDLIDKSLKIAQMTIESFDLKVGTIEYVPDNALNAIIGCKFNGRPVLADERLPKGSVIDLIVGDGHGNRYWAMYKYTEQSFDDVKIALIGVGLKIGTVTYVPSAELVIKTVNGKGETVGAVVVNVSVGDVVEQQPVPGKIVKLQDVVDLWVYQPDSIARENSILDIKGQ